MAMILMVISAGPLISSEPSYEQARLAYDAGDYQAADAIWRQLAEAGEVDSMWALGALLFEGPGDYPVNYTESNQWNLKASQLGHAGAQYNLGNAYHKGQGVPKDDVQAAYWWQKAADQGMPNASYNLGIQYMYGRGVPMDYELAIKQLQFAAARGHQAARKTLLAWGIEIPQIAYTSDGDSSTLAMDLPGKTKVPVSSQTVEPGVTPSPGIAVPEDVDTGPVETMDSAVETKSIATAIAKTDQIESEPETQAAPKPAVVIHEPSAFEIEEARVLDIPQDRYTLQLTVMSKPHQVDKFIRQYQLVGDMYRYRLIRDMKTLYGLSIGNFNSRKDAVAYRDQLERNNRGVSGWQRPWLRPFSDIQDLVLKLQMSEQ